MRKALGSALVRPGPSFFLIFLLPSSLELHGIHGQAYQTRTCDLGAPEVEPLEGAGQVGLGDVAYGECAGACAKL